jgi:hypothetical protein
MRDKLSKVVEYGSGVRMGTVHRRYVYLYIYAACAVGGGACSGMENRIDISNA